MFDSELYLREEMGRTRLIQRLEKSRGEFNPFSFGGGLVGGGFTKKGMDALKGICDFDYMGATEFEWGAVPNALKFLAQQSEKGNLIADKLKAGKEEIVYFIAPRTYKEDVKTIIKQLRKNEHEISLKERCGLKEYFDSDNEYSKRTLGWLELDNGFAFFTDKEMFDNFAKLLGVEPQ